MEQNRRYTVMLFPQGFDGNTLSLNIVLMPRNQDPRVTFPTSLPAPNANAIAFMDFQPKFELGVVAGLDEWPLSNATAPGRVPVKVPITVAATPQKKAILEGLGKQFMAQLTLNNTTDNAGTAITKANEGNSVKKYLPLSYRQAFNFTSPRHDNAVTDDSYHCALKNISPKKVKPNNDNISWGQLYANILRQPLLAEACGMIYKTQITINAANAALFAKGAYIYVDIVNPDYAAIQANYLTTANGPFIKRYAARIPKLTVGKQRSVFAPMLFPVLFQNGPSEPVPTGDWDSIFAEVNEYNDGFAKIVHAMQPVSLNMLAEQQDGAHPVSDAGIRLAWDDEQILIWYIRQLVATEGSTDRVDAPLGVFGYAVDVRNSLAANAGNPGISTEWGSLNLVASNDKKSDAYRVNGTVETGIKGGRQLELPYQVFPTQQEPGEPYWLPMYYTNWTGKSLVLKDEDAIAIHQNDKALDEKDRTKLKQVKKANAFDEIAVKAKLTYGNSYDFRVRLKDISGGSPAMNAEPVSSGMATIDFRRYIAPDLCQILNKPGDLLRGKTEFYNQSFDMAHNSVFNASPVISIKRPLLNYPAVVFTGKYQAKGKDPVQLILASMAAQGAVNPPVDLTATPKKNGNVLVPAIADPDVTKVYIKVEVETLRMDNQLSESGRENYIPLYETLRTFPADFDAKLDLSVKFVDESFLNFSSKTNPFRSAANKDANTLVNALAGDIPLPTARRIRVTFRAVCDGDTNYFGFIDDGNHDLDSRYGKTTQVWFYKESNDETNLLTQKGNVIPVQGIYLQPDPIIFKDDVKFSQLLFKEGTNNQPDIIQRLALQLGVQNKGLTLVGKKGERVVFGCSNRIRHHLSPDNSSITFSSKADLEHHWIAGIVYNVNRDWTWDALQDVSFRLSRAKQFKHDSPADAELTDYLGDIEIKHTASFEALQTDPYGKVDRSTTTIIFIDAIEPKTTLTQADGKTLRFPDEINVNYRIQAMFKPGHGVKKDNLVVPGLDLPTTIIPAQVPKVISAGIAFSPYIAADRYSSTEVRQRFMWVELAEPVDDPNDTLFCRVLAYAPDQLLSNNELDIALVPEEPLLPVDPEYIRVITPEQTDDMAGLGAMQLMEKANGSGKIVHYLMPIPPGLYPDSPEMFGFFTYEFRIGHNHINGNPGNVWSTAQGRFGRPLRITGMQHPAPTLLCNVNRDNDFVYASAPYAKAVFHGRNVTSDPPRTSLYCLLYAQVIQADKQAYRNILLDDKLMTWKTRIEWTPIYDKTSVMTDTKAGAVIGAKLEVKPAIKTEVKGLKSDKLPINKPVIKGYKGNIVAVPDPATLTGAALAAYKDAQRTGMAYWTNDEIADMLVNYGLPEDAPLSVLVVETFGNITNSKEMFTSPRETFAKNIYFEPGSVLATFIADQPTQTTNAAPKEMVAQMMVPDVRKPLSNNLGNYRILRTSPLTEVPFVCCPTCD